MELINGSQLALRAGVSPATISKRAGAGQLPFTDQDGRKMYDPNVALPALKKLGLTARNPLASLGGEDEETELPDFPEARENHAEEMADVEGELPEPDAPGDVENALTAALAAANVAFKDTLSDFIDVAEEQDEITLLRLFYRSGAVFESVRAELTAPEEA